MRSKPYYSVRTRDQANDDPPLNLGELTYAIISIYSQFDSQCYFQGLGYSCVDEGHVGGRVGMDVNAYLFRKIGKAELWPPRTGFEYSENDLFDLIEFMFDCAGKPVNAYYHDYYQCGSHCRTFQKEEGQNEFREEVNAVLSRYSSGFELSKGGEVLALPETGFEPLVEEGLPQYDSEHVEDRVKAAIKKFRYHRAPGDDRCEAVRGLVDVLGFLKPQITGKLLSKDESDLFSIANNLA